MAVNLRGALTVQNSFGEIKLEQAKATSYDLRAGSGSVTVNSVQGRLKAYSDFGPIIIKNAENATVDLDTKSGLVDFEGSLGDGPHNIHSSFGEIHITISAHSALNVDLETGFGSIKSEIPITVTLTYTTKGSQQAGTMNNGGSQLTVETENGSTSIEASKQQTTATRQALRRWSSRSNQNILHPQAEVSRELSSILFGSRIKDLIGFWKALRFCKLL